MFLRALRVYSDNCEPPELTPDCPFAIESAPNIRDCGEECMDVLARNGAPMSRQAVSLESGLTRWNPKRPRTRRVRSPLAGAYDAREIYMRDTATGPPSSWRLAAALYGIIELATTPPGKDEESEHERTARASEIIDRIETSGLSFDQNVMPRVRFVVAQAVFERLSVVIRSQDEVPIDLPEGWAQVTAEVSASFDTADTQTLPRSNAERLMSLVSKIRYWENTASWDDVIQWRPPSSALPVADVPRGATAEDDLWIIERFTKTYLRDWSPPTLRAEWKYQHGLQPAPCSRAEMRVREVPEADLAVAMAERFAVADDVLIEQQRSAHMTSMLVKPALAFLEDGQSEEAAGLFEAVLAQHPGSADALNNRGFCILPTDPEAALRYFDAAIKTGQANHRVSEVNRMLARALLGQWTSVADLATGYLARFSDNDDTDDAFLWDISSVLAEDTPRVIDCSDVIGYVRELLARANEAAPS